MEVEHVKTRDTCLQPFVTNGLLDECDSPMETAVEDIRVFISNGLLDDASEKGGRLNGSGLQSNGLLDDDVDNAKGSGSRMNFSSSFKSNGQLEENLDSSDEKYLEVAQLMDSSLGGDETPASGVLDGCSSSQSQWLIQATQELPSLSQILHPHGRSRDESDLIESRSFTSRTSSGSITATTFDGKAITFKKKIRAMSRTNTESNHFGNLLETPIHRLKDQLSEMMVARLLKPDPGPSTGALRSLENELWVDRYRPSRFIDLLGDERVHRETLGWLKEWDYCVFGKKKPPNRQSKTLFNKNENMENHYEDAYHRPLEKLLLLSGPAGYGKTTLAHVAACQAGYEVMEINASDSRSGQVIDDRIRPTLESGSALGSNKPVCLVIDEIDGATGSGENSSTFIHKLIGMTYDNAKKGRKGKDKTTKRPLLRPIICICNDLYAASLTKLRQHARIIRFTRPADVHLTKRLRSICETEGLCADLRALTTLVSIAKGDMRGCLNTLQFIKARQQEVTETVIRNATVGMKEGDSSLTSVMSNLFAPLAKKRVKELGMSELEENRYVSRLSMDIDASGSTDKVALGCFEHYANLRHYEASLSRHGKAADWLVTFDSLSSAMRSEREYSLMPYLSYTIVPFYPLFNERGGGRVDRPKADWDALMKMRTNEEIYKSLAKSVQAAGHRYAGLRFFLSNEIMQLELAPYLNRIISPPMRPINSQVIKPKERALLARLVDIMVALELRFIQDRAEDGQLIFRLEPPIDAFITYDGKRAPDIAVQRYATRHVIAGEIDAQLIARHAEVTERGKTKGLGMFRNKKGNDDEFEGTTSAIGGQPLLAKRKAEALDIADKPPVDFFGRPIAASVAPSSKRAKSAGSIIGSGSLSKKFKVSYRFNEGNSAAVRKPVKVSSFL